MPLRESAQFREDASPILCADGSYPHPPGEWPVLALANRNGGAGEGSRSKEGSVGTPNTDSPLAGGGQRRHNSNTEQPEKEEDGEKQEEGVLPAGGRVTLSQIHTCTLAEWLMGIEDGGEKSEGKSTNTK